MKTYLLLLLVSSFGFSDSGSLGGVKPDRKLNSPQEQRRLQQMREMNTSFADVLKRHETIISKAQLQSCKYKVGETKVSKFQRDQFCGGIAIQICTTTIECDVSGSFTASCPAVNGKCPATPQECLAEGNRFQVTASGNDAIASGIVGEPSTREGVD